MRDNNPRIAVVTGASSGIGKETAKALAAQGWRVIGIGRDPERSAAAEAEIRAASAGGEVDMIRADLSLMGDTARGRGGRRAYRSHRSSGQQCRRHGQRTGGDARGQ